jgi:hypothetical protein
MQPRRKSPFFRQDPSHPTASPRHAKGGFAANLCLGHPKANLITAGKEGTKRVTAPQGYYDSSPHATQTPVMLVSVFTKP